MTGPRFNIGAAYNLAESATAALKGRYGDIAFVDIIDCSSDQFWTAALNPTKRTLLHQYLEGWELFSWDEAFPELSGEYALVSDFLKVCEVSVPAWFTAEALRDRDDRIWGLVEKAIPKAANAAFNLLFQDRDFLVLFHEIVRLAVNHAVKEKKNARAVAPIPRCNYIPEWLKKGVYHRDRGICQCCGRDVSGLLNLEGVIHLDHLLPLFSGGTNDATNFQLLCRECNLSKGGRQIDSRSINHGFW